MKNGTIRMGRFNRIMRFCFFSALSLLAAFHSGAQNTISVDGEKGAAVMRVIGLLEDDDDVQNVYANFEMSAEDMAKLEG